ncbi:MAG TPA: radical SAM family heme chaperone HemW [Magnetospirillaceae bacterium]|jgi:oxygen-independent coproporphyrinogen-3 oxidase
MSKAKDPLATPIDGPFGIYIHWPFCLSKCPYCDFNSHVAASIDHDQWRRSLIAELDYFAARTGPRDVTSVFFGGGTPSLMDPAITTALLDHIAKRWHVPDDAEITLEANPGAVDMERFQGFRAAGVNRLSIGVQALDDAMLKFLGRKHDQTEALRALDIARANFDRLSFDLIYARPGQTVAAWEAELTRALSFGTEHLSVYQLTIEENTGFAGSYRRGEFKLPDEDDAAALFTVTREICAAAGLPAYEVSNHAKPGAECRHNLLYWQGGEWLGIGPGAHGRLRDADGLMRATRQWKNPSRWLDTVAALGHGTEDEAVVLPEEYEAELLMMGLRLDAGISAPRFQRQTRRALTDALDPIGLRVLSENGMIAWSGDHLHATEAGMAVLNAVLARLLP